MRDESDLDKIKTEIRIMRWLVGILIPSIIVFCGTVYSKAECAEKAANEATTHFVQTSKDIAELKAILKSITVLKVKSD